MFSLLSVVHKGVSYNKIGRIEQQKKLNSPLRNQAFDVGNARHASNFISDFKTVADYIHELPKIKFYR
jgi:hypothetical protein